MELLSHQAHSFAKKWGQTHQKRPGHEAVYSHSLLPASGGSGMLSRRLSSSCVCSPPSLRARHDSFSVVSVDITEGVLAGRAGDQGAGAGWTAHTNYRTTGFAGAFALGSGFNAGTGIYTAQETGIYHVAFNVLLDTPVTYQNVLQVVVAIDERPSEDNGFFVYVDCK